MRIFQSKDSGTSFLELIISIGMLSVIGMFVGEYYRRSQLAEYEQRARAAANEGMDLGLRTIQRDLERRQIDGSGKMGAACGGSLCGSFLYRRVARAKTGGENSSYVMQWTSYCQGLPSNVRARFEAKGHPLDLSPNGIKKIVSPSSPQFPRCMVAINCPYGKYHQIVRHIPDWAQADYNNSVVPSYPWGIFPGNSQDKDMGDNVVAAAICADGSNPNVDRIMMEAAVVTQDSTLRFERKEVLVPRKSVSSLQILSE